MSWYFITVVKTGGYEESYRLPYQEAFAKLQSLAAQKDLMVEMIRLVRLEEDSKVKAAAIRP